MKENKRCSSLVTLLYQIFMIEFILVTFKDWLVSGVDFYPYRESVIGTAGMICGAWLALWRKRLLPTVWNAPNGLSNKWLQSIVWVVAMSTLTLLLVFLQDLPNVPWTPDTILGYGFGSRRLQMLFLSTVTGITPVHMTHSSLGAVVVEQGLADVVALACVILISAVGLCVAPNVLGALGLVGVDVLLLRACYTPSFLTLNTAWGTCALAVCLGCIGTGLAGVQAADNVGTRTSRPNIRRRLVAVAAALSIIVLSAFRTEMALRQIVDGAPRMSAPSEVPLSSISQPMQDATVAMEDGHFYQHHGIDWEALHRAIRFDLRLGEVKQGGSTITEQLAKNLYLQNNDRSLWLKLEDIVLAVEMEHMWSKQRILQTYLNTIDYGMGQHGIAAAAQYYFHQSPAELTTPEAAILVGIVPDPMQEELDLPRVAEGEQSALTRMVCFYPQRYSQSVADAALAIPLDRLIYPAKDAWDRYATEEIPAEWYGVSFYYYDSPDEPGAVENAARCFKDRLGGFLDDAHRNLNLVGIDHLGLYADRTTRFSNTRLSAHAFGQAMDMSGFRFADGTCIKVADHRNPSVMKRLAPVEAMLKRHFDVVVDWNDNALHQTHFHVEVKGRRSFPYRPPTAAAS